MSQLESFINHQITDKPSKTLEDPNVKLNITLANGSQHPAVLDTYNKRLKIYSARTPSDADQPSFPLPTVNDLSDSALEKLMVYSPEEQQESWQQRGLEVEGQILGFFPDRSDAVVLATHALSEEQLEEQKSQHDDIIKIAQTKTRAAPTLSQEYLCRPADTGDIGELSALLQATFPEYPCPLDPEAIAANMEEARNLYRIVRHRSGALLAAASAELQHARQTAELTDCATAPEARGQGLMAYILSQLEEDVRSEFGIADFYSTARATEVGMNCVFSKLGYEYTGRLQHNCRMPEGMESLNLWCKQLDL